MYRWFGLGGLLALAAIVFGVRVQAEDRKDDKPKDIGEIMKKAHAGDGALKTAVTKALKAKDYKKAGEPMKAWVAIASHLGSFTPPRGGEKSWKKQSEKYGSDVKALAKAIDDKDADAASAALKTINTGCGTCHKVHRKPKK